MGITPCFDGILGVDISKAKIKDFLCPFGGNGGFAQNLNK